mmetsp:Transcript_22378/g.62343  ORF Transcript_22378/g.62343 Transcript_22378/m.62343 type:complete len:88 (-) Transcript_22378:602-865(-)
MPSRANRNEAKRGTQYRSTTFVATGSILEFLLSDAFIGILQKIETNNMDLACMLVFSGRQRRKRIEATSMPETTRLTLPNANAVDCT